MQFSISSQLLPIYVEISSDLIPLENLLICEAVNTQLQRYQAW